MYIGLGNCEIVDIYEVGGNGDLAKVVHSVEYGRDVVRGLSAHAD